MTQAISKKLRSFFPGKVSKNKTELCSKRGKKHMPSEIASWKLTSVGLTLRKPATDTIKQAL